jgi:hypothetical protein
MRRYIILAAALLAYAAASAQNLNPTVQVTNDYEGKLMEVEKQNVQMAVPDSLLKFDWNFNYSVFDNPYRGAYEFSPYRIDMKPEARVRDSRKFYLRAGAGYSLHPEVQAVLTPEIKGRFGFSLYDDFKGYTGLYHGITLLTPEEPGPYVLGREGEYSGSDFSNRLGGTLRYDAPTVVLTFDAGMDLIRTKEQYFGGNSMLGGSATFRARSAAPSDFAYDVKVGWTGLGNKVFPVASSSATADKYTEHDAGFDAKMVYRLADSHAIRFEPSYHHVYFCETKGTAMADIVDIAPSYVYSEDGFSVKAGIRYSDVWRSADMTVVDYDGRKLFPDFRLSYEAILDKLVLSAKVVGGQKFNTYGSYLKANHHLPSFASEYYSIQTGDATVNAFDAGIGVSGQVRHLLQFGADAGFARYLNAPLLGIVTLANVQYPIGVMIDYDLLYLEANGSLSSDRVDAAANLRVQKSNLKPETKVVHYAVTLPVFTGGADFVYNWNRRVFAGLTAEWATSRKGESIYSAYGPAYDCVVPGWIDLGVTAEFRINSRFSVWAEGRNLLNQTVMRNFMIAEKGPYFTAGICLNL